ncbi:MAG TPA: TetR/AcrR family transcriptional regulator [Acidimicrobiia bacterium]|nr:TetR/AcrR family transcriptional regulator [Acidimicrobiia bacterium]
MSVTPTRDRRSERHEATRAEILEAAWGLAREQGLAGLSLRDLGRKVGMRAQSLYSYFDSKHAIYDALFRQGNEQMLEHRSHLERTADPEADLRRGGRQFVEFCVEDPARYQLLFQRTIPGFEPSAESYALAVKVLEFAQERFRALGVDDPAALDLWTALLTGLIDQQISNDPGGDRWVRLYDEAVDMFFDHVNKEKTR